MKRVLVANRGEIAVRIIRACRDAGLESVAVHSDPDAGALHARLADHRRRLPGSAPAQTYLDGAALIAAAVDAGADAVHPGYGFLSENADFARDVASAGLVWIGPSPEAIAALGDKVVARRIAAEAGAPMLPATDGPVASAAEALRFVEAVGLPVIVKASKGGGGRGMRIVHHAAELERHLEAARREARLAFGNDECFVERYLEPARHVETQCLADRHGTVLVLGTRDCSLQRRQQKLVEEAPAPFLDAALGDRLAEASRRILRKVGYVGAGTCEFLVGPGGELAFLEVNTRVQVEHPATEEALGVDIIRAMLRIASGESIAGLPTVPIRHAIEFRINAEDPAQDFRPASGTIERWRPALGPGIRLDAGYEAGETVPPNYDSLIAKLIVSGADRREALERARRALAEFEAGGIATTLPFLRFVADHPDFAAATPGAFRVHTRWIDAVAGDFAAAQRAPSADVAADAGEMSYVAAPAPQPPSRPASARPDGPVIVADAGGTILEVLVGAGTVITRGDVVAVLESMKMEYQLVADRGGRVAELRIAVGDVVGTGEVLCLLEPEGG